METDEHFTGRLDRDSAYRICALNNAIARAGQDGGIEDNKVDVFALAGSYYAWLLGKPDAEEPIPEKLKGGKE